MGPRVSGIAFAFLIFLSFFPGSILSAAVKLKSVELYATHTWIAKKPNVFFQCIGENKTFLPDVEETGVLYSFKGEESWQPLTELHTKKCKRCGIYEDLIPSDHVFYEWELCSSNFAAPDGHYTIYKEGEVIATFLCEKCSSLTADPPPIMNSSKTGEKSQYIIPILTTAAVAVLVIFASMALYKCWQKRKRQREQARFMKLFEDDDDIEDELGLREML